MLLFGTWINPAGLHPRPLYLFGMSLRLRKKPPAASLAHRRGIEVSRLAHNQALHYLTNHPLSEDERAQLTEVVYAFTGPCDIIAAREGLAWLRERLPGAWRTRAVLKLTLRHMANRLNGQDDHTPRR